MDEAEFEIDPYSGNLVKKPPHQQAYIQNNINRNLLYTKPEVDSKISNSITTVYHGSNANYPRPANSSPILWTGSIEPVNAINNDLWVDTT